MLTKRDVCFYSKKFIYYNQKTTREQKICKFALVVHMQILQNTHWCDICLWFGGLPRLYLWVGGGVFLFMAHSIHRVGVYTLQMFVRWHYYLVRSICFFFSFQNILPQQHTHTHKDTRISDNTGRTIWLVLFCFLNVPSLLETQQTHWSATRFLPGRRFTRIILGYRVEFYG